LILSLEISLAVDQKETLTNLPEIEYLFASEFYFIELQQTTMIKRVTSKLNILYGITTVISSGADISKPLLDKQIFNTLKY
jgi:hypothetical protein